MVQGHIAATMRYFSVLRWSRWCQTITFSEELGITVTWVPNGRCVDSETQTIIASISIICPSIGRHFSDPLSPEKVTRSLAHPDDISLPALLLPKPPLSFHIKI
jgi:hypothetical protein